MNTNPTQVPPSPPPEARRSWVPILAAGGVLLAAALAASALWLWDSKPRQTYATVAVKRGPLTISVSEAGTIKNREKIVVKSEVEGRRAILWLIPEGTSVQAGELLVELDSAGLQDERTQQQITVLNAEAAFIRARENLAVARSQAASDIAKAELDVRFAEVDLNKYIEGEYPQQVAQAQAQIEIAKEELNRATDKAAWSRRLAGEGYITATELQADELALKRTNIDLELAQGRLALLEAYTYKRDLAQLESNVAQTKMAMERVTRKTAADIVQSDAELKARESEFHRQQARLEKIDQQIAKCRITAPVAGVVVYATTGQGSWRGNAEPLDKGQEVMERQELIHLPTTSSMIAEVKVHESSLRKLSPGLPVRITVDALPGRAFRGTLGQIAMFADAQSVRMNPDLKVYNTEIYLEGDGSDLRSGMSCRAEIVVQTHADALYVPVQAVTRVDGQTVAYVMGPEGPRRRAVQVGLDNNREIHVLEGLSQGEMVLLNPPLEASGAPATAPAEDLPAPGAAPAGQGSAGAADRPAAGNGAGDAGAEPPRVDEMTPEQRRQMMDSLTPEQRQELMNRAGGGGRGSRGGPGTERPARQSQGDGAERRQEP